jgi:hypothetical protein
MELLWPILHNPITWWIGGITGAILLFVAFAFAVVPAEVMNAPHYGQAYQGNIESVVWDLFTYHGGAAPFQSLRNYHYDINGPWGIQYYEHVKAFRRNNLVPFTLKSQAVINAAADGIV